MNGKHLKGLAYPYGFMHTQANNYGFRMLISLGSFACDAQN